MMDTSDSLIFFGGTLSGIIAGYLYSVYRSEYETAAQLKEAETVRLGAELRERLQHIDGHCISYASVEGLVTDLGKTFSTKNSIEKGVIVRSTRVQNKSERVHGFWKDTITVLQDYLDAAPFAIQDPDNPSNRIIVTDATEASELMESLEVTHDNFVPYKITPIQLAVDRIFGEVCHGIQEVEQMLTVGSGLVGVGEILLEDGHLKLRPPQAPNTRYFLTKMTKDQLIKQFQSQVATVKTMAIMFGVATVGLASLLAWRLTKKYLAYRKTQREFQEARRTALRRHAEARCKCDRYHDPCVVCLGNPREVVTLDCGHIAMCCDCAEMLPTPHKCPVCRERIERFLPVYRP